MRFAPIILGLAASASAAMSSSDMVSNIDEITQKSSETNDIAKSIGVTNFFSTAPVCYPITRCFDHQNMVLTNCYFSK